VAVPVLRPVEQVAGVPVQQAADRGDDVAGGEHARSRDLARGNGPAHDDPDVGPRAQVTHGGEAQFQQPLSAGDRVQRGLGYGLGDLEVVKILGVVVDQVAVGVGKARADEQSPAVDHLRVRRR
jgi:hypothetical protein